MPHEHTPYPTSLPYDEVMVIVNGVRKGTLLADPPSATKALWELSGYAALMSVGEPSSTLNPIPAPAIHTSMAPVSDQEILEHLETYASAQREQNPDVVQALNIPWAAVLKWAIKILLTAV